MNNPLNFFDSNGLLPQYWSQKQRYGQAWHPTDASRRNAGDAGAKFFGEIGTYASWVSAAAAAKKNAAAAAISGTASLAFGSASWLIDKLNGLANPNDGDNDNDGIPDNVDTDDDNDGIPGSSDPNPYVWSPPPENPCDKLK